MKKGKVAKERSKAIRKSISEEKKAYRKVRKLRKTVCRHSSFTQPTLFKRSLKEFLKETCVDINKLYQWFELGWLSFNPKIQKVYDDKEYHEVTFIKGLVRLGLTKEKIIYLLSQLEKPYCYSYKDIYWDFDKNEWKEFSQIINKYLDDNLRGMLSKNLDSYLETLSEERDIAELERIRNLTQELRNKILREEKLNSKSEMGICPEHNVKMKKAKIIYGLLDSLSGELEEKLEAGEIILGGCSDEAFGEYGFVCPVDKEPYVIVSGHLIKVSES